MVKKNKSFTKTFWSLFAGSLTITAISTTPFLTANHYSSNNESKNNITLSNQYMTIPLTSMETANQSNLLWDDVKKDFVNNQAKADFIALMNLPSMLNETLKNHQITATVNYGVADKDLTIPIWDKNDWQPIPIFPNVSDSNQNISYLNPTNSLQNLTQLTVKNLKFNTDILTDDNPNFDAFLARHMLSEVNAKNLAQNTLKVVDNNAIEYTVKYRQNYKNFSFTPKFLNAFPIKNGIPVIDYSGNLHRHWLATQYEQNFINNQAQDSINNYFGQIDPNYLRNGGFILSSTFRVNEVLNTKDPVFTEKLRNPLEKLIQKYGLNTKPNDNTGEFYRIVRLDNAYDLGDMQRIEHPADYVWYLGDAETLASSYYLMQFEAPNKLYNLSDIKLDPLTNHQLYFENKSPAFVNYTSSIGGPIVPQSQALTFELNGKPHITTQDNQGTLTVQLKIPNGVRFNDITNQALPENLINDLTNIYAKYYNFKVNNSSVKYLDNWTLEFNIGINQNDFVSFLPTFETAWFVSNPLNVNFQSKTIINQSETITPPTQTPPSNPSPPMQPDWSGQIGLPVSIGGDIEHWYLPYKITELSPTQKRVELLWNESNFSNNFANTALNPNEDRLMSEFIQVLQNLFFNPKTDANGNTITYKFNDDIKDTIAVKDRSQTQIPYFEITTTVNPPTTDSTILSPINNPNNPTETNGNNSKVISGGLDAGSQAGIAVGVIAVLAIAVVAAIFLHKRKNQRLLSNLKKQVKQIEKKVETKNRDKDSISNE